MVNLSQRQHSRGWKFYATLGNVAVLCVSSQKRATVMIVATLYQPSSLGQYVNCWFFMFFFFFFHFNPHRCSFTDSTSIFLEFKQCVIQVAGGWTRIRILVFLTTMLYYLAIMIIITFWRSRHCGILETWWDLESWRWRTWLCFSLMVYRLIYSYITMLVWSSLIVMWSWASK